MHVWQVSPVSKAGSLRVRKDAARTTRRLTRHANRASRVSDEQMLQARNPEMHQNRNWIANQRTAAAGFSGIGLTGDSVKSK
jgi:hypothetical protein